MLSEIPPVVPCKYDGSRCAYEGLRADRPCWGDVMAPNDDLLHTCEGHWDDGTYEPFEAAKHRPPPVDRHAQARDALAARIRRENDMPTAHLGDPFAARPASPAPAWTREAPKECGRYWMRSAGDREAVDVVEVCDHGDGELSMYWEDGEPWIHPKDTPAWFEAEWWPVRLEPPK